MGCAFLGLSSARLGAAAGSLVACLVLTSGAAGAGRVAPEPPSHPFGTGILLNGETDGANQKSIAYRQFRSTGANVMRINVAWSRVAPAKRPTGFDPTDPGAPAYTWDEVDSRIAGAVQHGFDPLVTIYEAPRWAQQWAPNPYSYSETTVKPNAAAFKDFVTAMARRYDGSYDGLPRVRYWEIWNEPNLSLYIMPQLIAGKPYSPVVYRRMLNLAAGVLHAVHRDNVVIAGALAPFRDVTPSVVRQNKDWGPLSFMRSLLCLSPTLKPTCSTRVSFDAFSIHPYTSGDARHHASLPNDVSLGDVPKVRAMLDAALQARHIAARGGAVGLWVSEFSWDTSPPDELAVPMPVATRWVAEALHRMWLAGVTNVVWLMLTDEPTWESYYQSGLYFHGSAGHQSSGSDLSHDKPKPILEAFRFPVVAYPASGFVDVWGRVPFGTRAPVGIEQKRSGRWVRVGMLRSDPFGVFRGRLATTSRAPIRGRLGSGETSAPFSLTPVPDKRYNPFGSTALTPKPKP